VALGAVGVERVRDVDQLHETVVCVESVYGRKWHMYDSQGPILALAFKSKLVARKRQVALGAVGVERVRDVD